jgi:branched-chain amino acid transport system substrate-binding protein
MVLRSVGRRADNGVVFVRHWSREKAAAGVAVRPARVLPASLGAILIVAFGVGAVTAPDDVIVLGAAISITGKYAQNGANTKNGYDLAIKRINEVGGVVVGSKHYRLAVRYYDDESTPARGTELAERLIKQMASGSCLAPTAPA